MVQCRKPKSVACETGQWVRELAAKAEDPSSIPGAHIVEEENGLGQIVL